MSEDSKKEETPQQAIGVDFIERCLTVRGEVVFKDAVFHNWLHALDVLLKNGSDDGTVVGKSEAYHIRHYLRPHGFDLVNDKSIYTLQAVKVQA